MTEREQLILYIATATLVLVVFIAVLLIRRHGHTVETKKILEAIEGGRQQMSVEHQAQASDIRATKNWMLRLLNRFGFLTGRGE